MRVVTWDAGRVAIEDSVLVDRPVPGDVLRDAYAESLATTTLGVVRMRGSSVMAGPLELLRFGPPRIAPQSVDWPIEGGLLAGAAGGHWRIRSEGGRVTAAVEGYRPRLPRWIYTPTHLQVHLLFTRLFLLRMRGREPQPAPPASRADRLRAATVDVAFCLTLARVLGRRRRVATLIAITAGYHVACWSISGRTLGGLVMRQRVVAVDGSRLTPAQSLLRFALLPVSWIALRPVHDDIACTEVVSEK
jgi:hypothetical protein